jgi:hypothetical protein
MQTKIKKIKFISLIAAILIAAVFAANRLYKSSTVTDPENTPTVNTTETIKRDAVNIQEDNKNNLSSQENNTSPQFLAPKQQEITKNVTKEIEYRLLYMNDPLTQNKWFLDNVKAPETLQLIIPENTSIVAVIDSGFALDHEDLTSKWATNDGETGNTTASDSCWTGILEPKNNNNCDDDNNGYVDDWRGWDFYYVDNLPNAGSQSPDGHGVSHGTEVAGIVGAESNNGMGIASLGYTNKIMPLQVMNDDGTGYTSDIVSAIYYAVDNGANVINLSLGSVYPDDSMKAALDYASSNNVIIVAAAGNCGESPADGFCEYLNDGLITYPARYQNVIAVGSVNQDNVRSSFSSYGPEIDIVAPGDGTIASTSWSESNQTSLYMTSLYGTSFASPLVASVAGLVKSHNSDLDIEGLRSILVANSVKVSGMNGNIFDDYYGHGLLDSYEALTTAKTILANGSTPSLLNTGNQKAESFYSNSSSINASCETTNGQLCSISFKQGNGKNKYAPYKPINNSTVNWSWSSNSLSSKPWEIKAVSGNLYSSSKIIFNK